MLAYRYPPLEFFTSTAKSKMFAGELDRRITLRAVVNTENSFGEPIPTPSDIAEVWAKLIEKKGGEIYDAGLEQAQKERTFLIRHRTDIDESTLVSYEGDEYDIKYIQEVGRRRGLMLYCMRRRG